jgi:hypothetical protein
VGRPDLFDLQDLFLCSTQDRVARRVCGAGEPVGKQIGFFARHLRGIGRGEELKEGVGEG